MEGGSSLLKFTPENILEFNIVGGHQSSVNLQMENLTDNFVAFKIKTTAPKNYLVKPSAGVVRPKSKVDVSILLIPLYEIPKEAATDRFLIQSTIVDSDRQLAKDEWIELAHTRTRLEERRMTVNFNWCGYGTAALANRRDMSDKLYELTGKPLPSDLSELSSQYEDLVAYAVAVEKQRKELEIELDELRRSTQQGAPQPTRTKRQYGENGLEYWQVGIIVIAIVCLLKIVKFL